MRLHQQQTSGGFTLIETVVAATLAALFLTSLFTMNVATMDTIRCARESVAASQILQQRMESMRIANWHEATDASWLRSNLLNTEASGSAPLRNLVETLTLDPYGSANVGTTKLTRSGGVVTVVSQNTNLLLENAVKVVWTATYSGAPNNITATRQIVAILAKGGVAK